jgi:hypothetical protein
MGGVNEKERDKDVPAVVLDVICDLGIYEQSQSISSVWHGCHVDAIEIKPSKEMHS